MPSGGDVEKMEKSSASPSGENGSKDEPEQKVTNEPKKLSKLKTFWTSIGLDAPTVMMMAKGGLPPVIALAM